MATGVMDMSTSWGKKQEKMIGVLRQRLNEGRVAEELKEYGFEMCEMKKQMRMIVWMALISTRL